MHYLEREDQLNKYISWAIVLHVGICLIGGLIHFFLELNLFRIDFKEDVNLVNSSVRVDVLELPKHTIKELEQMDLTRVKDPDPIEKTAPTNETSEVELKVKSKKVDLKNLFKNISNRKIEKAKKIDKKTRFDNKELQKLVLAGNKISKGSSTTGEKVDESMEVFVGYVQSLPDRVRPNWKLPSYLMEKELRCRIRIFLADNGKILRTQIYESSGDSEYDQKALEAVKRSSPLPIPDKSIVKRVVRGEVILGFPL